MYPGKINPKKMKQMMKQMGMEMEELEGVERVIIHVRRGLHL